MRLRILVPCGLLAMLAGAYALHAQTQSHLLVVSAAGGVGLVAPGSFAVGYGPIGATEALGQVDDHGLFPTDLGGYSVLVNGTKAQIQYVGPTQVNFIVPADAYLGDGPVLLRSSNQDLLGGPATIRPLAPAVFTMVQGSRELGAILNAVTFVTGPFNPTTTQIQGCDQRTRLAIFATGIGFSVNRVRPRDVRVEALDPSGTVWPLEIDAAVAAPGLPAVEQINVVLPAGMGAGTMLLSLYANGVASNKVAFDLAMPVPAPALSPAALNGTCLGHISITRAGQSMGAFMGTVSLARPAPGGGLTVQLTADAGVVVPASVQITGGNLSTTFAVTTAAAVPATFTVTATTAGGTRSATFAQGPACVDGLGLAYTGVVSGQNVNGNVTLTDPAPDGGVTVVLATTNNGVSVTPAVTVPAGQMSGAFTISTSQNIIPSTVAVTATAACGGAVASVNVVIVPCVASLSFSTDAATGGNSVTGTVVLNAPAQSGGLLVNMKSANANAQVDSQVIVQEGQTSATFQVRTNSVMVKTLVAISATVSTCGSAGATLTLMPMTP